VDVIAALLLSATLVAPDTCACRAFLPDLQASARPHEAPTEAASQDSVAREPHPEETHLRNLRQLTFGGQNAEAYWNLDGSEIVYQTQQPRYPDEQIYRMNPDGSDKRLVSTGLGRCTCGYFTPDGRWIYFSSTHTKNRGAQVKLDMSQGYLWMVNPEFSLYRVRAGGGIPHRVIPNNDLRLEGGGIRQVRPGEGTHSWVHYYEESPRGRRILRRTPVAIDGYIAETTIAPDGSFMTFTATFEGDLQIYRANLDGTRITRLTNELGYDGGPFVSWCSNKIVYRRASLDTPEQVREYKDLLARHLVRPGRLEIWIMDADGSNKRQVTNLGAASFAPFLHPNGRQILFSSNYGDPKGREFDLFLVNVDGTGLQRVTHTPDFDGFPMFSRDGRKLLFSSNRHNTVRGETNVFVADWVD
jgi:TolB protein